MMSLFNQTKGVIYFKGKQQNYHGSLQAMLKGTISKLIELQENNSISIKGVLHLWTLIFMAWCTFSKNKATLDKVSNRSD